MAYSSDRCYEEALDSRATLNGPKIGVTIEPMEVDPRRVSVGSLPSPPLYENNFFSRSATLTASRKQYFKMLAGGIVMTTFFIFGIFSILWGAFYRTPARNLSGWIVDFDGGLIGQSILAGLTINNPASKVTWTVVPADKFPGGVEEVSHAVAEQMTWIAVTVNSGASKRLEAALVIPNASYDGAQAVSIFAAEARNENAFRSILRPSAETPLTEISRRFAAQLAPTLSNSSALPQVLVTAPQTITAPIWFKLSNLQAFDQPIASVVTFTGLIFLLILSFFVVMIGNGAREATKLNRLLTLRSLITLRLATAMTAYFILSLFYSLLSLAFQLNISKKFGHAGFIVFWMLNFVGMSSVGLALEAMLSLLTAAFVPFFLLPLIIANVAVVAYPIEVLPRVYHYGYAAQFYNISKAARSIIFGTKNRVGFHFGILIAWIAISCITLTVFQFWARGRDIATMRRDRSVGKEEAPIDLQD